VSRGKEPSEGKGQGDGAAGRGGATSKALLDKRLLADLDLLAAAGRTGGKKAVQLGSARGAVLRTTGAGLDALLAKARGGPSAASAAKQEAAAATAVLREAAAVRTAGRGDQAARSVLRQQAAASTQPETAGQTGPDESEADEAGPRLASEVAAGKQGASLRALAKAAQTAKTAEMEALAGEGGGERGRLGEGRSVGRERGGLPTFGLTAGPKATATLRERALPLDIESPRFTERVAERVSLMIGERASRAELELNPPEWGKLRLAVEVRGDSVAVKLVASTAEARRFLEAEAAALREALDEQGLDLSSMDVSVGGGDGETTGEEEDDLDRLPPSLFDELARPEEAQRPVRSVHDGNVDVVV